jgi:endonuclease I/methionine-rich copper-binding protein CopC
VTDIPPTVSTTSPVQNATGVALAANVIINFSEPVTAATGWYAINCATSGAHPALQSGGISNYILNPNTDFVFGELCTVQIDNTKITDLDGTPNAMAAPFTLMFTAVADLPPTVTSTNPTNGQTNVSASSNLTINFSEPVSASGTWYNINCGSSAAHTAVVTGGPSSFVLNPDVDFSASEVCTLKIFAANVLDQDGTPNQMAADFTATFTIGSGASSCNAATYYNSIDASNAANLRTSLHNRIKDHTAFSYSGGTTNVWTILEAADEDPLDTTKVRDVYLNRSFVKVTDRATGSTSGTSLTAYNREHTWPNSHGFNNLSGLDGNGNPYSPYTDTHMLYTSVVSYNASRGNKPYGDCPIAASCAELTTVVNGGQGGGSGVYPGNSNWTNASLYEGWNARKGDLARAIMYMDVRYEGGNHANGQAEPDLRLTDDAALITTTASGVVAPIGYMGLKTTLIAWHNADPPDARELFRNEVVCSYQGNRNPYIDHPEYVNCMYNGVCAASDNLFRNGFE